MTKGNFREERSHLDSHFKGRVYHEGDEGVVGRQVEAAGPVVSALGRRNE